MKSLDLLNVHRCYSLSVPVGWLLRFSALLCHLYIVHKLQAAIHRKQKANILCRFKHGIICHGWCGVAVGQGLLHKATPAHIAIEHFSIKPGPSVSLQLIQTRSTSFITHISNTQHLVLVCVTDSCVYILNWCLTRVTILVFRCWFVICRHSVDLQTRV